MQTRRHFTGLCAAGAALPLATFRAPAQELGAGHGVRIVVKGQHPGAQPPRRQGEEPGTAAQVQQPQALQALQTKQVQQGGLGLADAPFVQARKEAPPVGPEAEAPAGADLPFPFVGHEGPPSASSQA